MAAAERSNEPRAEPSARTLGDVVYANAGRSAPSEQEWVGLVRSIAAGDQVALHTLYTQTHRIVFTLIVRIAGNSATAEELTVDVFHDVWRRAPSYDPAGGSVVGWIMNQARSRAIDRVRFEHRKKRVSPPAGAAAKVVALDPHEALDLQAQGVRLRAALQGLTVEERQAIEMAYFSDMTYREVASRLNQPLGTVKTRIRSGLGKLRQALAATPGGA
jgi:RNA polymerase sigma-70 factor, ECF subfamily